MSDILLRHGSACNMPGTTIREGSLTCEEKLKPQSKHMRIFVAETFHGSALAECPPATSLYHFQDL